MHNGNPKLLAHIGLSQGIYGMNIKEINSGSPRWWAVVATGIPLVLLTILVPLFFDRLFHISLAAMRSRLLRSMGWTMFFSLLIFLFVSDYFPWTLGLHLSAIPLAVMLLYSLRMAYLYWSSRVRTEFRFYILYFFCTLGIGLANELTDSVATLPFMLLLLVVLPVWWSRDRLMVSWQS
jgi:hypothetical protein